MAIGRRPFRPDWSPQGLTAAGGTAGEDHCCGVDLNFPASGSNSTADWLSVFVTQAG